MGQLTRLWRSRVLSNRLKVRLDALVAHDDLWKRVVDVEEQKKHTSESTEAFEIWCYRRALRIAFVDRVSNDEVLKQVSQSRLLPGKIKSQKLRYFGHVARHPSLQNSITLGSMPGTRRQGGQRRQWVDDITDWAGLKLPEVVPLANETR